MAETGPTEPLRSSCPRCGKEMESGFLIGGAAVFDGSGMGTPGTISWSEDGSTHQMELLARSPGSRFARPPAFPAERCDACRLAILDYRTPI